MTKHDEIKDQAFDTIAQAVMVANIRWGSPVPRTPKEQASFIMVFFRDCETEFSNSQLKLALGGVCVAPKNRREFILWALKSVRHNRMFNKPQ